MKRLHEPIGKLVVQFQTLEFIILMLCLGITKDNLDVVMAMLSVVSFRRKLDVLRAIAPYAISDSTLGSELTDLIEKASHCEEQRNTIVHSIWLGGQDKVFRHKPIVSRKHGLKNGGIQEFNVAEIDGVSNSIGTLVTQLKGFLNRLHKLDISRLRI